MFRNSHFVFFAMMLFFFTIPVFSLPTDKTEKVHIIADSGVYNYKTGSSIFVGNVKVDQGTSHITADRLTTKNNAKRQIEEAIAYGLNGLAHYWTLPKIGDPEIHAHAKIIKFYPIISNITLSDSVLVTQGENSFHGQLIHYNMNDQTITVPASKEGRAELIYDPES